MARNRATVAGFRNLSGGVGGYAVRHLGFPVGDTWHHVILIA
jgi:hypothetical protein